MTSDWLCRLFRWSPQEWHKLLHLSQHFLLLSVFLSVNTREGWGEAINLSAFTLCRCAGLRAHLLRKGAFCRDPQASAADENSLHGRFLPSHVFSGRRYLVLRFCEQAGKFWGNSTFTLLPLDDFLSITFCLFTSVKTAVACRPQQGNENFGKL